MYTKLGGENSLSVVFFGQLDLGKVVDFFLVQPVNLPARRDSSKISRCFYPFRCGQDGALFGFFFWGKIQESCDKRWFFETVGVFVSRPFLKGASTWYFNQYHFFCKIQ